MSGQIYVVSVINFIQVITVVSLAGLSDSFLYPASKIHFYSNEIVAADIRRKSFLVKNILVK